MTDVTQNCNLVLKARNPLRVRKSSKHKHSTQAYLALAVPGTAMTCQNHAAVSLSHHLHIHNTIKTAVTCCPTPNMDISSCEQTYFQYKTKQNLFTANSYLISTTSYGFHIMFTWGLKKI